MPIHAGKGGAGGRADNNDLNAAVALQRLLWSIDGAYTEDGDGLPGWRGCSIRPPVGSGSEWLITMRGDDETGKLVAFVSGFSLEDALRRALAGLVAGSLKWKEDTWNGK
jgi:hypothetical protein